MSQRIPVTVQARVEVLRKEIIRLRDKYHKENISEISDEALDSLKHELAQIEETYPSLITADSPTQTVSGEVKRGFEKVSHKIRQWSFNDIFSEEEMEAFDVRIKKELSVQSVIEYYVEEKIDGVKVILEYVEGKLFVAATRGDGIVGENITENVKGISDIPQTLKQPVSIIVEGEVYMTIKEFEHINKKRKEKGEEEYANPRNLVAGSLRQLDSSVVSERNLKMFAYDIGSFADLPSTQGEELSLLKQLGFPTNSFGKVCKGVSQVYSAWKEKNEQRESLPYWIDGLVVKVNNRVYQEHLGYTGKAPRFAIAFKFAAEQAITVLEDIVFQVGRTALVTPVAQLKPVSIAGSVVSRATLHNEDQINRLDVRVGDTVVVQKAGDIIPEIVDVIQNLRPKNAKKFVWPKKVVECGGDGSIMRVPGSAAWRCVDRDSFELTVQRLAHFVSKKVLDIDGLGERTVRQLVETDMVSEYVDFFHLTKDMVLSLEGFKDKSADNLITSIENAREVSLARLLFGLSIDGVGEEVAVLLANHFGSISALQDASKKELERIHGIGYVLADSIVDWFADKTKINLLQHVLKELTVTHTKKTISEDHPLFKKRVVVTGRVKGYSRSELKQALRDVGALVSDSVSQRTNIVFAGEDAGSKLEDAEKLGVQVVQGDAIGKMLSGQL